MLCVLIHVRATYLDYDQENRHVVLAAVKRNYPFSGSTKISAWTGIDLLTEKKNATKSPNMYNLSAVKIKSAYLALSY